MVMATGLDHPETEGVPSLQQQKLEGKTSGEPATGPEGSKEQHVLSHPAEKLL